MSPDHSGEDNFSEISDDDDPMDVDSNTNNHATHSIMNIDAHSSADLRRLAMESTDTLEQLASKANLAAPGAAADKARSLFVTSWLMENYEVEEDHNVPRSSMYAHYLKYCQQQGVRPVNSASFGKLIRSVFPDLKTRRLGTRGQSKYHYCGVRVRNPQNPSRRNQRRALEATIHSDTVHPTDTGREHMSGPRHQHEDPSVTRLPDFPPFPDSSSPPGVRYVDVVSFLGFYRAHCQAVLDYVQHMRFGDVEGLIKRFWHDLTTQQREMTSNHDVVDHIYKSDAILYDTIMNLLLPNVLQPMPLQVIQAIRSFARSMEGWLFAALASYPQMLCARKIEVARVFIAQLRRHTSLNHLAQAAGSVFESPEQLQAMLQDWSRIDFDNIRDQASWVCECKKADVVQIMEIEFKQLLAGGSRIEHWTSWLASIVDRFLHDKMDPQTYLHTARQLLMKWSFYSSLAMRDLTLRSAQSFGSFHLVRLLYDEYIFYVVEQRIANNVNFTLADLEEDPLLSSTATYPPNGGVPSNTTIPTNTITTADAHFASTGNQPGYCPSVGAETHPTPEEANHSQNYQNTHPPLSFSPKKSTARSPAHPSLLTSEAEENGALTVAVGYSSAE